MAAFGDGYPVGKFDPRSVKLPVPVAGIFDEPFHCVPINVDWRGYLVGVIERLAWGDVWDGDEDAQYSAVQEIYKLVSKMATGGCEVPQLLRQKPGVPCILEYSNDDGDTWDDAFDFSQCTAIATSETAESIQLNWNISIEHNADTVTTWDNDLANIAPDFVYDDTPEDNDRDKALCYAIRAYVDMICDAAIGLINDQNADTQELVGVFRNVAGVAGVISGALATVGLFPAALTLAGLSFALSSALVGIASIILADDIADYEDAGAREEVACLMFENLFGATPTRPQWKFSADATLTGAAETIRETVDAANQSRDAYLQLMIAFNDAVALADELDVCPCSPPVAPFTVTFASTSTADYEIAFEPVPNFTISIAGVLQSSAQGNPTPSAKMPFGSDDATGYTGFSGRVRITLPAARTVDSVEFEIYYNQPASNVLNRQIILYDDELNVLDSASSSANDAPKQAWTTKFSWTGDENDVKYIDVQIGVTASGWVPGTTYGYIDNVVVH